MAIKTVNEIPGKNKKCSQRELIRKDIREAYEKGIEKFEFEDEIYKYDTLVSNAKDAVRMWFRREIFASAERKAKERFKEKIKEPFWCTSGVEYDNKAFALSKKKLSDRVHVYCSVNYSVIKLPEHLICET